MFIEKLAAQHMELVQCILEGEGRTGIWVVETACSVSRIPCHHLFDGEQLPNEAVFDPMMTGVFKKPVAGEVILKALNFSMKINHKIV